MHILDLLHEGNPSKPGHMALSSGKVIDLMNFDTEQVDIYDIAVGLCNTSRFGGQTETRYSVAQHCMLVASLCPPDLRPLAMLHDAEEAFWGDMIRPLKDLLIESSFEGIPFLRRMANCRMAILKKYDIEWDHRIKFYDDLALQIEIGHLYGHSRHGGVFQSLTPYQFAHAFEMEMNGRGVNANPAGGPQDRPAGTDACTEHPTTGTLLYEPSKIPYYDVKP